MPTLSAATVFAIPPDGATPIKVVRSFPIDILTAVDGTETRIAQSDVALRRQSFSAAFVNAREAGRFRALWYAAAQPLRFQIPLWREQVDPTAIAGAVITADTTLRRFVAGGQAIAWQDGGDGVLTFETFTVQSFNATTITASAPLATTFTIGLVQVMPLMNAWLEPPSIDERGYGEVVPLTFREELPSIAGIDATIDAEVTPVVSSITVYPVSYGVNPWPTPYIVVWAVDARDADGVRIIDPAATWAITAGDTTGVVLSVDIGRQACKVSKPGSNGLTGTVTVLGVAHNFGT